MHADPRSVDPALCPVCGADNVCGNLPPNPVSSCWCADPGLNFPAERLSQIPTEARGKACVCRTCATTPIDQKHHD